jgi:CMP-N,N'-diacetyllegionaminic acid synthase
MVMFMKVLILGFGSIGKRHARVLSGQLGFHVEVVTCVPECGYTHYASLADVGDLQRFDYFVIATATNSHYQNLLDLDAAVSDRIVLIEKPVFHKEANFISSRNRIYVGYNLRFHPALQKTRELLLGKKVSVVNVHVGEYLPWWRPGTDYRTCYSAKRVEGGGVVFDLSHEIDYVQWLFGTITKLVSLTGNLSDLEIDSDDYSAVLGITDCKTSINLSMDYLSMLPVRSMLASMSDASLQLDLEHGLLTRCDSSLKLEKWDFSVIDQDLTYREMHRAIIYSQGRDVCTLSEGLATMRTITAIYSENMKERWYGA